MPLFDDRMTGGLGTIHIELAQQLPGDAVLCTELDAVAVGLLTHSATLEKKGKPFWGRPFFVGQPPKKRETGCQRTTELSTSTQPTKGP